MSLITTGLSVFGSAIVGGIVSYFVSRHVAKEKIRTEYDLQSQWDKREWYKHSGTLAELVEHDWWEVMTSGEADYEVESADIFVERRDELREHAAEGKTLGVNEDVVLNLEQAAADLNYAINNLNDGAELADIEKELLPVLDSIEAGSQNKVDVLSDV